MLRFIEQVSGFNIDVSYPILTQESSLRIICGKEMRHLGKNENVYNEIEKAENKVSHCL